LEPAISTDLPSAEHHRQVAETALYFPHMQVPKTAWFTQVLLYWDKAASIVPDVSSRDFEMDPYMEELRSVGLLEFVPPHEALQFDTDAFALGFLELLDQAHDLPPDQARRYERLHPDRVNRLLLEHLRTEGLASAAEASPTPGELNDFNSMLDHFTSALDRLERRLPDRNMHMAKMDPRLFRELRNRGRAIRNISDPSWWKVESTTAALYMAYLASAISGARPGTFPVTDSVGAFNTLGPFGTSPKSDIAQLRAVAISRALPSPSAAVPARELVDFKDKNAELLRRCRIALDARLTLLAEIEDPDIREIQGRGVLLEIEDEVKTLTERMKRRSWPKVGLSGFCGISAAGLTTVDAFVTNGSALAQGIGVGLGILSLAPVAEEEVRVRRSRHDARQAPLAYAALAGERFS
jgi:hypothetical protein